MIQQKKIISFRLYLFFITLNITSIVLNEGPIKIKIKIFNPSNEKTKLSFTLVPTSTKSKISKGSTNDYMIVLHHLNLNFLKIIL